ncbi:hypothetical protein B7463_g10231, partial [Scytalidium lignicola]
MTLTNTDPEKRVVSIAVSDAVTGLQVPVVTWWKHPGLRKLCLMMPILMLCATINGIVNNDRSSSSTATLMRELDFNNPSGSTLGLFTAIMNIGGFSALFFSPYCADVFGRRIATAAGVVIMLIGVIIQLVPGVNRGQFVGGRFLVGFGSNISIGAAPLLIMELAYPQHRSRLTTLYNTLWYVGSIVAAWTVYGTIKYSGNVAWRVPVAIQGLMPVIQLVGIFLLPESPRWLCSKDRGAEAMAILVKYHASGNADDEFVKAEFAEIQETLRLERELTKQGWDVFLRTPGNRKRLLLIVLTSFFSQCSGNGLSLFNGGLQIWSWLVSVCFSVVFVDKLGRKLCFMIAGVGMLITFSVWTGCSAVYAQTGNKGAGSAVLAMIFLFYGVAGFAWPGLTVAYCAEILPYNIRAKGLALCLGITALSGVINQYVNPIGLSHLAWKFYFVYIVILVIEVFCIWFIFVETRGPTLEEIATLFEGDDPNVAVSPMVKNKEVDAEHVE